MSQTAAVPGHAHAPVLKMGVPIPNGKLGMWLFLGTEIMFFTAFIGTYIVLRLGSKGWPDDPHVTHISIWAGATNTFVLITSSVFVVLAYEAMTQKNYKRATNWIVGTTALALVFLGIKSYEYYGKWSHDILPGHVAESPQQALDKLVRELDAAAGVAALQQEETKLSNQIAVADSLPGQGDRSGALKKQLADVQAQIAKLAPVLEASRPLKDKAKNGKISYHEAGEELKVLQADPNVGATFRAVHEPHFIKWGNTFSSVYFIMTGFHALHVIIGIGMFAGVAGLGLVNRLGAQHCLLVENFGLYWHFVDLVWIFLFPLIYIV